MPLKVGLLYHDMEKGFCAQYIPLEFIASEDLTKRFNKSGGLTGGFDPEKPAENTKPYNYMDHFHVVFIMEELIR